MLYVIYYIYVHTYASTCMINLYIIANTYIISLRMVVLRGHRDYGTKLRGVRCSENSMVSVLDIVP